jgi:hypothetical protein
MTQFAFEESFFGTPVAAVRYEPLAPSPTLAE